MVRGSVPTTRFMSEDQETLLVADNTTGYIGVRIANPGRLKPFRAEVKRDGKMVSLGSFATAEEAALWVAGTPEGQAAAAKAVTAAPPTPPLTSEEAQQQAEAEGLTLRVAKSNKTGFSCVYLAKPGQPKPFQAQVRCGGKMVALGHFATVEEAALCVARSPEGRAAAQKIAARAVLPPRSEEVLQQAQAEGLMLLVADNTTGYFGVYFSKSRDRPYQAQVWRGGKKMVALGSFTTAEEAALCVARSPEGQAAAKKAAAAPPPLTSEEARRQAQAEGLTLDVTENKTGYFGVHLSQTSKSKPYQAQVRHGGKMVHLGRFATAEEAALCIARSPEGQKAMSSEEEPPPLTSEEALQQARAEARTLRVADNKAGYFGVYLSNPGRPKPFQAQLCRGGKQLALGCFATAEEAALCVARSPEGRAAVKRAAAALTAAPPLTSEEARQQAQAEELTLRVADNKAGYFGVTLKSGKPKPFQAKVRRGGKGVHLGYFATAEEAALCIARSPEGQATRERAPVGTRRATRRRAA